MAGSRRPAASQAMEILPNSSHDDVLEFLSSVLTVQQYSEVTDRWAEQSEFPDGQLLLSCQEEDLGQKLGMPSGIAKKVAVHLRESRATQGQENEGGSTPLVDPEQPAPQEVSLQTAGPSGAAPQKRNRGRPPKVQPRLSQRLEGLPADKPGRRMTRQRVSRLLAVQQTRREQAEKVKREPRDAEEDVEDEAARGGSDDERMSDVDSQETRAESLDALQQQAEVEQGEEGEQEQEQDQGPDEDDGVHPRNGALWEEAAREGLEDILKLLPVSELISIVEEELWENDVYQIQRRNPETKRNETKTRPRATIARRIVKMVLDGRLKKGRLEDYRPDWTAVDDILERFVDDSKVQKYLDERLKLQFAALPRIRSPRAMLWRLWSRAQPPAGPAVVTLGCVTVPCYRLGPGIRERWRVAVRNAEGTGKAPYLPLNAILSAMQSPIPGDAPAPAPAPAATPVTVKQEGIKQEEAAAAAAAAEAEANADLADVVLMENDDVDYGDILLNLKNLSRRGNAVTMRCEVDTSASTVRVHLDVKMEKKGDVTINGCFVKRDEETNDPELIRIYLDVIFKNLDHVRANAEVEDCVEALNAEWDVTCDALEAAKAEEELKPPNQVTQRLFDSIMAGVEDLERPMEEGVEEDARERLALKLKAYQLRALSFMLREERAAGGTARHLWLELPLPGDQPGVKAYVSPSLFSIYLTKSAVAAEQAIGTRGGSGWQALEMGMGKTAVVIAGMLMNQPPADWRAPRAWSPYSEDDYMTTVTDNMPRGGTLVIVPTSIIRQWELEVEKTLDDPDELSLLRWLDGSRILDCKDIAEYDIVLTTPQSANRTSHLRSIFWHRIVVDEAQLNAGSVLTGDFFSTHRWIVTGTPCNAEVSTLDKSLEFLRLGGWGDAQRYLPPALGTVLRAAMVRYTKAGRINGETNLELPPLTERVVACQLNEEDAGWYKDLSQKTYKLFLGHINSGKNKSAYRDNTLEEVLANPATLLTLMGDRRINLKKMQSYVSTLRSTVGGGIGQDTGETEYNPASGVYDKKILHWYTSKAEAVVEQLAERHALDPDAKMLVFSSCVGTLKAVAERLPSVGLDHRSVLGSTSAKKRGEAIEAFMSDPPTKVFLLGAASAGVGITLTAASEVIICEPFLNPALEMQAVGRSRRMGQTKAVTVTRMYTAGTVEERTREVVARRAGTLRTVSTAAAANAGEVKCSVGDWNEMMKCDLPDSDDGEEVEVEEGEGPEEVVLD